MNINNLEPNRRLYHTVRAGFVARGTTLTAWCRQHEVNPTNARATLIGVWDGPKGRALRAELIEASCINAQSAIVV